MKVSKVLVSIVLLFSLTLASCAAPVAQTQAPVMETSMSTETQEAPAASTETLAATDDSASMSEGVEVEIEDFAYLSAAITIKVGTTVTWTNKDSVRHTVSSDTGLFESGLFGKGESFSHTFTEAGTFTYHCAPHPYMKGTVIVE
ncbi:MAG: cupredoxin domain-containing protein [Anaerolineaceae bacterium]